MSKISRVFYVISCRGGDLTDISQGRALNDEQISKVEQQQECHKLLLGIFYPELLVYWKNVFPVPMVRPFW